MFNNFGYVISISICLKEMFFSFILIFLKKFKEHIIQKKNEVYITIIFIKMKIKYLGREERKKRREREWEHMGE